ncbi:MAG TPA: hypothetical protein VGG64_18720 [Pirellulales bacterium]|jgi:hypothetical protein
MSLDSGLKMKGDSNRRSGWHRRVLVVVGQLVSSRQPPPTALQHLCVELHYLS